MSYIYQAMYGIFFIAACVAVAQQSELDEWISLVTNGAIAVTSLYAYKLERYDISIIALFGMCTSLVWHSSGKYKQLDAFVSRYMAYYAFGTSALSPTIIGPAMLFITLLFTYEDQFEELYMFVPLLCLLVLFRWLNDTITRNFIVALVVGTLGIVCYRNANWHSMWHVLGALAIALTIEPPERQARFYVKNTPIESP